MMDVSNQKEGGQFIPVAVVGMGGLFPGAANLTEFWENILDKKDCIEDVPAEFWDITPFYDPDPLAPDKTYCKRGGFLPEVEFDAMEFGIPPKNLESISMNQLLALKVARDTLLDARMIGTDPIAYDKERVGVILGAGCGHNAFFLRERLVGHHHFEQAMNHFKIPAETRKNIIHHLKEQSIEWQENSFPGYLPNIVCGRIANRFDFSGVSYAVDAACASSLCAISQAIHELHTGNCDIVLSGGVNVMTDPGTFVSFSKTPALSRKNQIRPFDKDADGMVLGDGIGMLVLKRLEDAEADGDRIYAVIRGIGASSDGRAKSVYAPSIEGQINCMKRAYAHSVVNPAHVQFLEGHGTGTVAGDLSEIKGINAFYGSCGMPAQHMGLGSVKSQIGHTVMAAGAASTIKTVLALHQRVIPPMINVDEPHPDFELEKTPCYISSKARPWIASASGKRTAGVNSFGFGGVNYHLVLEEYDRPADEGCRINRLPESFLISGSSTEELISRFTQLQQTLRLSDRDPPVEILRRFDTRHPPADHPRIGMVASGRKAVMQTLERAIEGLKKDPGQNWRLPGGIFYRRGAMSENAKIVALFPGQGVQYPDMGIDIALNFPEMQEAFQDMDDLIDDDTNECISDRVYPKHCFDPQKEADNEQALNQTRNAQPALAAFCSGLYAIARNLGFKPDILVGHSFGELTALWAAGAIDRPTFYRMSIMRGLAMQKTAGVGHGSGKMMVVKDPPADIDTIIGLKNVCISNYNSPAQLVVSGSSQGIAKVEKKLAEKNIKTWILNDSCAFHSLFMKGAKKEFADQLRHLAFNQTTIPVYSNLAAKPYPDKPGPYAGILAKHLVHPVLFSQSIEAAFKAGGRVFVEFGPRQLLSGFVRDVVGKESVETVTMIHTGRESSLDQMMEAITHLRVLGIPLGDDPYRLKPNHNPGKENSNKLVVSLKGQQYLTPETRERIKKAREKEGAYETLWKEPAVKTEQKIEGPQIPLKHKTTKKGETMQPLPESKNNGEEAGTATTTDDTQALDRVLGNQIENSRLQAIFLQNQAKELELIDKLTEQQQALFKENTSPDQISGISRIHARHMEYIRKTHDDFFEAHLAFLNQQQMLLARMTGDRTTVSAPSPATREGQIAGDSVNPARPSAPGPAGVPNPAEARNPVQSTPDMAVDRQREAAPADTSATSWPDKTPSDATIRESGTPAAVITETLLAIISDKTGYPVDMLELSMNFETDLGIDSIKRLEIFSALYEQVPALLENIELTDLGEIRTLQDVISLVTANAQKTEGEAAPADTSATSFPDQTPPDADIRGSGTPAAVITETLLAIISDKTGYPVDMLELSMNFETDLGIDSIKRLEIFSALYEQVPALLENIELTDLGEIRTLQDVISLLEQAPVKTQEAAGAQDNAAEPALHTIQEATSLRFTVHTEAIDLPEISKELNLAPERHILITEDGTGAGAILKARLKNMGHAPILLEFKEYPAPIDDAVDFSASLDALDDPALKQLLEDIKEKQGHVGGFIHLSPLHHHAGPLMTFSDPREEKLLKAVFFMAKHLKKPLSTENEPCRSFFLTVTRMDGLIGMNGIPVRSVIQGGYAGLVKSLKMEAPRIFCRSIDLASNLSPEAISALTLEELHDTSEWPVEIGRMSEDSRFTIGKKEMRLKGDGSDNLRPDQSTVFLVTGGGRGITARCVEGLAEKFKSRFILLGRTKLEAEPSWAASCTGEKSLKNALIEYLRENQKKPTPAAVKREIEKILSQREIRRTLERIHESGGKGVYVNADITQSNDLKTKITTAAEDFGPVTGIIHGAGNLADRFLEKKNEADFDIVYHTKITGLKTVLDCVDTSGLRYLILFSSISGYYGKEGQADYALSNEILNKLSHAFFKHHPDACIRSINWGPWDGGMVSPELKQWYKKFGVDTIPVKEGVGFLVNELAHARAGNSQLVICPKSLDLLMEQVKGRIS